jgi:hypothetical protein
MLINIYPIRNPVCIDPIDCLLILWNLTLINTVCAKFQLISCHVAKVIQFLIFAPCPPHPGAGSTHWIGLIL